MRRFHGGPPGKVFGGINTAARRMIGTPLQAVGLPNRKELRARIRTVFNNPNIEVETIGNEFHFDVPVGNTFIRYKTDGRNLGMVSSGPWIRGTPDAAQAQQRLQTILRELQTK
jgi:hypothetical protein